MTLRRGDFGAEVKDLQSDLAEVGAYLGDIDGEFGPMSERAVAQFGEYRCFETDGEATDGFLGALAQACSEDYKIGQPWEHWSGHMVYGWRHPKFGPIPHRRGKLSHFGGPLDKWDRFLGQALWWQKGTPRQIYAKRKKLLELGLLVPPEKLLEMVYPPRDYKPGEKIFQSLDEWPLTTRYDGRVVRMSYSGLLDTDNGYYNAMPYPTHGPQPNPLTTRVLAINDDDVGCMTACSDRGPHERTGKVFDGSKATLDVLGLVTGQRASYCWGEDSAPLGPL